nr:hypothetical protein [Tanacetum cinerariifolium]
MTASSPPATASHLRRHHRQKTFLASFSGEPQKHSPSPDLEDPQPATPPPPYHQSTSINNTPPPSPLRSHIRYPHHLHLNTSLTTVIPPPLSTTDAPSSSPRCHHVIIILPSSPPPHHDHHFLYSGTTTFSSSPYSSPPRTITMTAAVGCLVKPIRGCLVVVISTKSAFGFIVPDLGAFG